MYEEYLTNSDGLVVSEGTWSYKIPTVDTIPKEFNVEILNSGHHQKRVLSSKGTIIFVVHFYMVLITIWIVYSCGIIGFITL